MAPPFGVGIEGECGECYVLESAIGSSRLRMGVTCRWFPLCPFNEDDDGELGLGVVCPRWPPDGSRPEEASL